MVSARLTFEGKNILLEELAEALQDMLDTTCADMVPLWLEATSRARRELGSAEPLQMSDDARQRLLALGKASRSKYRSLAVWRHAVLWHRLRRWVSDPVFERAMEIVYFTPYPSNDKPYAWTRNASEAPGVGEFDGPRQLKHLAKEGAYELLMHLRELRAAWERDGRWAEVARLDLTRAAVSGSAWDVLKLDDHPRPIKPSQPVETRS